jgi:3-keto-5-aminohexanoate cleavage enzyme
VIFDSPITSLYFPALKTSRFLSSRIASIGGRYLSSADSLIVTVAVTGSAAQWQKTPYLPITPQEIADSAVKAYEEGAAIAHIHVRDPITKAPNPKVELYREVLERIKDKCDMIVQLTTGGGGPYGVPFDQRMCALDLYPDSASLNVATMTFGDGVFMNQPADVERAATLMMERGVKPEVECYDVGHIALAERLIEKGLLKTPLRISLVLGVVGGIPAKATNLVHMMSILPKNSRPNVIGIGKNQFRMLTLGIDLGADARVGMEDNIYLSKGVLAKNNAELVAKIVRIAKEAGREVATPTEAREILDLKGNLMSHSPSN